MSKFKKISTLLAAALVAACGGGGGSPGTTNEPYTISLRADKIQLPINISHVAAGIGVYSPYTTTLYVDARKGSASIPGGEDIFGCNVSGGLSAGSLYYLDGKEEHEVEVDDGNGGTIKVPGSYRSITLPSNSGGSSFHFHAGDEAGDARITCSVTDPSDGRVVSTSVNITVGGATGKAASVKTIAAYDTLGTQNNQNNLRTASAIEAYVLDDANQPLPASGKANLQVAIVSGGASSGARLLSGSLSGSVVQVSTTGGVGQFSLSSGTSEGTILLELTADRFDNDVTNGIQDPIVQFFAMPVTTGATGGIVDPVTVSTTALAGATNGLPYSYALSATGGVAPYTWVALGGLPEGLSLSASGVLSGTPAVKLTGSFVIAVRATDSKGTSVTANLTLAVAATPGGDPVTNVLAITSSGCGSNVCQLTAANPAATAPANDLYYKYALSVTGPGTGSAVWTTTPALASTDWLKLSADGTLAISWAAADAATVKDCTRSFPITAVRGGATTTRTMILTVGSGAGTCP